jgi:glycosyltransferase involved in cell wall biosynthesis
LGTVSKKDIPELMNAHDIYIQTNRVDNMPVSLLEAWASGLSVIATNVGGIPYLIQDGVNGILVESEDYEAMARRCLGLLNDPEKARSMAKNGRLRAQELTWKNVSSAWKKVLDLEFDDIV